MAHCTGCGAQVAANSRFCSLCGKEVAAPTVAGKNPTAMPSQAPQPTQQYGQSPYPGATTGTYAAPEANNKKKIAIAAVVGSVVTALALVLILRTAGVLGAKPTEVNGGTVLTAPETRPAPAPILTAPQVTPPSVQAPVLTPPQAQENPMPEDVVAYLRWLKQFDAARRSLENRGIAAYMQLPVELTKQMMNEFDENNAGQPRPQRNKIADEIGYVVQQMNEATGKFQQYPPPNPAAPLASAYLNSLSTKTRQMAEMQGMVTSIFRAIDTSGNSNSAAQEMLPKLMAEMQSKTMSQEADAADSGASNALNTLRGQYTSMPADVRDFDIKPVNTNLDPRTVMPPGLGLGF
ncbi:MAG: hypothetical protein OHK0029_38680 [Armatimonadaceae bacterium]